MTGRQASPIVVIFFVIFIFVVALTIFNYHHVWEGQVDVYDISFYEGNHSMQWKGVIDFDFGNAISFTDPSSGESIKIFGGAVVIRKRFEKKPVEK